MSRWWLVVGQFGRLWFVVGRWFSMKLLGVFFDPFSLTQNPNH